jgi:hypothetical protein
MPGGNGNGSQRKRFNVSSTMLYKGCRNAIEARFPMIAAERVFDWLELRMHFDPTNVASYEGGMTWVTRTQGSDAVGAEFPAATVFFTLAGDQIVLQSLIGDDEVEDELGF